jgi:hypothetical protein
MNQQEDISNELTNLAPALIGLQKLNIFFVPENYFNTLPAVLLAGTQEPGVSVLSTGTLSTMNVPAGYFDTLAENILLKIKTAAVESTSAEIQVLSPALSATGNDNIFTVPRGYFEDLPAILLNEVTKQPAKVITLKPRTAVMRYAVAAVITGMLGLSLFSVLNKTNAPDVLPPSNAIEMAEGKQILAANSFDKVLATVNDEEIISYLQNHGEDIKAALVASAADSKELPAADEYLTNDNTLNNFMNELNLNDYSN